MTDDRPRSLLTVAIEREDWETAAMCLAMGLIMQARRMPPGALDDLIAELDGEPHRRRHRHREGRHGRRR
jgi:hypothetical protein